MRALNSMNGLVWRNLTAHPLRSILTALAITLGVAMVLAATIVGQAAGQSASELAEDGPRIDLEVFSRDGAPFDDAVLDTLRAFPDVDQMSPALRVEVKGVNPQIGALTLLGVDPPSYATLHEPELANGAFLDEPDTVVLPMMIAIENRLNIGDEITLTTNGRRATLTVAGRLRLEGDMTALSEETVAFLPLGAAQTLADMPGQIDRVEIALRLDADAKRVQTELAQLLGTDLTVVRSELGGGIAFNVVLVQGGLAIVGIIILFAAAFVILNAFMMSITGRTREIGALRSLGMTRRQVMRAVLIEAGWLGLVGAALGLLVGIGLAWSVMRARGTLDDVPFVIPWWGLVLSASMGLVITLVGALAPAQRASRVSPLVALRPQKTDTSGWYVRYGGRLGAALVALLLPSLAAYGLLARPGLWIAMAVVGVGIVVLLGATVLLLPVLVSSLAARLRPIMVRRFGTIGRLAADNLARNRLRSALTAGALVVALTTIIAPSGLFKLFLGGSIANISSVMNEDMVIIADFGTLMASGEIAIESVFEDMVALTFDPAVVEALDPLAQAGAIELQRVGIAPVPPKLATVPAGRAAGGMFVDLETFLRIGNFSFFEGDAKTALQWMRQGPVVLLQPLAAERLGVGVGETLLLETPRGHVAFTVAGIGGSGLFSPIFSYADGERYFDLAGLFQLGIVVSDDSQVDAVLAQVQQAVAPFPEVVVMKDVDSVINEVYTMFGRFQSLLNALLLMAVIVAGLGVLNTMVINITERGREIGLLRAVGATQRQVRQSVIAEATTLGLVAVLTACALGLAILFVYTVVVMPNGWVSLGLRSDWATVWSDVLSALGDMGAAALIALIFAPLVAALAAYYPARQAAALDVVEATRGERVTLKPARARRPEKRNRIFSQRPGFSLAALAVRNLAQHRLRTTLSALAVALGVAMIVAASVTSSGVRNALESGENIFADYFTQTAGIILNAIGFVILVAAGFMIFNAFAMAVTQRRRQIGALRVLGMTRGCERGGVMQLVLAEALLTGGAGTLVGLMAGPMFGHGMLAVMRRFVEVGRGNVSVGSLVLATVMGLGITVLSALVPARRAACISPLVALRRETSRPEKPGVFQKTWLLGPLITIGLILYLIIAPPGEWTGNNPPWEWIATLLLSLAWLVAVLMTLPALIGGAGRGARGALTRLYGATGRLMTDNLGRDRRRVTLTVLTFAVGLMMIASLNGMLAFMNGVLLVEAAQGSLQQTSWFIYPFDRRSGLAQLQGFNSDTLGIAPAVQKDVNQLAAGRARVSESYMAAVPEISSPMPGFPSPVSDLDSLTRPGLYTFVEGDWETARPIMASGCGLLLPPAVAARNGVGVGDALVVTGKDGPVACTVAGIGRGGTAPMSIVSAAAKDAFVDGPPASLTIWPLKGTDAADIEAFEAELRALANRHGDDAWVTTPEDEVQAVIETSDQLESMAYGLLLLAIVAAALGMINTTMMSVAERRHELGLLRAVGATRRQTMAVVAGEAALIGLVGGLVGLVAGAGLTVIFCLSYGGIPFGLVDLNLWRGAWQSVQPALVNGLIGILIAPIVSGAVAWWSTRAILRGSAIETLAPRNRIFSAKPGFSLWQRGSIRTRFVLGTAVLMITVLVGLIAVVTTHARARIQEQTHDALRTMVTWNAGMIELGLPEDTQTLDFEALYGSAEALTANTAEPFARLFDPDAMLRFESLMDDMTADGLIDLIVADRDNVVLVGLDTRDIGTLAAELETADRTHVYSERAGGAWLMHATAPVRNADDLLVGSVRMTIDARQIQGFLGRLRNTLGAIGVVMVLVGATISWGLATPLARATRQLAAHAAGVARGEYHLYPHTPHSLAARFSMRAKLTVALTLVLILMVGLLERVALPIERHHVQGTLKDSLVAGIEWIGQVTSQSLDAELSDLASEQWPTFEELLDMTETLDLARLQELTDQMRSDDVAYTALLDEQGSIALSDQLALIGTQAAVPRQPQIEETTWRGQPVWLAATPLRRGQDGQDIGALQIAVRLNRLQAFLDESRNLFRLTGLIAVLAGVLLAQAIGGAVTAPVRQLVAGTRRIAEGDLDVRFRLDTANPGGRGDELTMLASAYNQMVVDLREREWLRDMFGRFVSREVAQAIRSGQVKLEGENRVVSVLFCDIRDFTARSERHTPQQIVALLNAYLPLVVQAAGRHGGTVNKFGGDSTLVIYGAPRQLEESAYQAVLTALEMRANLERLNARLAQRGEDPIRIGVGINTGVVLAGVVGPEERQEYTVIGDTVNLASRIEALNKTYPEHDVLISGQTYEALGSRRAALEFADLGQIQIRGKAEPVRVWAVVKRKQVR